MHSSGFVHLDMKCGNILLDPSNKCMIADLGMTDQVAGRKDVTFKGTYPFMAPEVWNRAKSCDLTKVDMYAFGAMIYELLSAQQPWQRMNDGDNDKWIAQIQTRVVRGERPDVDTRWDKALVSVMQRCWAPNPSERPSAAEALSMLA